jgi:hypothetical protein
VWPLSDVRSASWASDTSIWQRGAISILQLQMRVAEAAIMVSAAAARVLPTLAGHPAEWLAGQDRRWRRPGVSGGGAT